MNIKDKIIVIGISVLSFICISPRNEKIASSNLFSNNVQRVVRNKYKLEREYYINIK